MRFLKKMWCATIVFLAYRELGYYGSTELVKATKAYFSEKKRLRSDVLTMERHGIPIGTLMCSKDAGWLPTDEHFPREMEEIRRQYGDRIGYFGKLGVVPTLQGIRSGLALLERAVTEWSIDHEVDVAVMMVNPKHLAFYKRHGARVVATCGGTKGLEKAPAVLLVLEYANSEEILAKRTDFLLERAKGRAAESVSLHGTVPHFV